MKPRRRSTAGRVVPAISVRAFARRVGVTENAVRKGAKSGRLERSLARGTRNRPVIVDVDLAEREWRENQDPAKLRSTRSRRGSEDAGAIGRAVPAPAKDKPSDAPTTAEERRRLMRVQAEKAELEVRKLGGQLVEVSAVRRAEFEAARTIRDNVLNIPDRVAAEFAAETDAGRIHARLTQELRQALGAAADALIHA